MSRPRFVPNINFVDKCPACQRTIGASSILVLDQKYKEHVTKCMAEANRRIAKTKATEAAAIAQPDLFGGKPK